MASSYTTGFSLEKIGSGEQSGAWGDTTNFNWDIVDRLASYKAVAITTNADTATLTVREASPGSGTENLQDGMYRMIKFTGALDSNCTITIAPNTAPAYFIIENATTDSGSSGPYSLILSQGSGANVTVQNGKNAIIYCDGAGSGAAVVDALADLQIGTLEVTGAAAIDGALTLGGAVTGATNITLSGELDAATLDISGNADIDGTTNLDAVDIDGVVQIDNSVTVGVDDTGFDVQFFGDTASRYWLWDTSADGSVQRGTLTVGVDDTGHDVKFFGATSGRYMLWDESADTLLLPDNVKASFGTGSDLQIYHDGSDSYISDGGTGDLKIGGATNVKIQNPNGSEVMGIFAQDGAVTLYHNNVVKFATSANGASITGTLLATTDTDTTNSGDVQLDYSTNQNFVLTFTGNVVLTNPNDTEQVGQAGVIVCIQDATGSRTLSLGSQYKTAGDAGITLSTAANAVDIIPYFVSAADTILIGAVQLALSGA